MRDVSASIIAGVKSVEVLDGNDCYFHVNAIYSPYDEYDENLELLNNVPKSNFMPLIFLESLNCYLCALKHGNYFK